jgi:P pilus assembly chaperone PapD
MKAKHCCSVQLTGILFVISFFVIANSAYSNITVSPVSVYLTNAARSGELLVRNTTSGPLLVKLELKFGYPSSDSTGTVSIAFFPDSSNDSRSCASWLYLYPRRFILYPGQSRTIRVIARPAPNLPDGEYWARLIVASEKTSAIDSLSKSRSSVAALDFNFNIVIPIFYRKGKIDPDVSLLRATYAVDGKKLFFYVDTQPTSNAAYIGNITCQLLNTSGVVLKEKKQEVAIYVPIRRRFEFDRSEIPAGTYKLRIIYDTERPEERGGAIYASPRTYLKDFVIR